MPRFKKSLLGRLLHLASWTKEFLTEYWQTQDIDADTLRLSTPRENVPVRTDPAHLQQLLWTLCNDLLKYGRATSANDPIEIRVGRRPPRNAVIST